MELLTQVAGKDFEANLALESGLASLAVATPEAKELLGSFVNKTKK